MFNEIFSNPESAGQVLGAIIGVIGLFVGTFITIFTTIIMRRLDIRREEKKEELLTERQRKEKEFNLKQDIYSNFITELAALENFISKPGSSSINPENFQNFDDAWTKIEIKIDLVASQKVVNLKEIMQLELFDLAKERFASKANQQLQLSPEYMASRQKLLEAIREDMEIIKK